MIGLRRQVAIGKAAGAAAPGDCRRPTQGAARTRRRGSDARALRTRPSSRRCRTTQAGAALHARCTTSRPPPPRHARAANVAQSKAKLTAASPVDALRPPAAARGGSAAAASALMLDPARGAARPRWARIMKLALCGHKQFNSQELLAMQGGRLSLLAGARSHRQGDREGDERHQADDEHAGLIRHGRGGELASSALRRRSHRPVRSIASASSPSGVLSVPVPAHRPRRLQRARTVVHGISGEGSQPGRRAPRRQRHQRPEAHEQRGPRGGLRHLGCRRRSASRRSVRSMSTRCPAAATAATRRSFAESGLIPTRARRRPSASPPSRRDRAPSSSSSTACSTSRCRSSPPRRARCAPRVSKSRPPPPA